MEVMKIKTINHKPVNRSRGKFRLLGQGGASYMSPLVKLYFVRISAILGLLDIVHIGMKGRPLS